VSGGLDAVQPRVLITTVPFGQHDSTPFDLLGRAGVEHVLNPLGRRLKEHELADLIGDYDAMIAGTEPITDHVMSHARRLKLIVRVGIGLDSVDLHAARRRGIRVAYTPDAPAMAVSDLTIGLMISLLRQIHVSHDQMRRGHWHRHFGRRLGEVTVGIIGLGRIGTGVLRRLQGFGAPPVLVSDIRRTRALENAFRFTWADTETVLRSADVVTVHVPLTARTRDMIRREQLEMMKPDAVLINTARGGIVNENDLYDVLKSGHLAGAAIDVFEHEPYDGRLREIDRCLLTAHMGSMSIDCRTRMEVEATAEAVRFFTGAPLESEVPEDEYASQAPAGT
jgi:D-3-phosphoglycerate dehydrogenase